MSKNPGHIILLISILLISSFHNAFSSDAIIKVYYLLDTSGNLPLNEVQNASFELSESQHLNFGYSAQPYWLKFKLSSYNEPSVVLIKNHYLEEVSFYIVGQNEILDSTKTGLSRNLTNVFSIEDGISENEWLYVKISSGSPLRIPIKHFSLSSWNIYKRTQNTILGVFYGIYGIILVFSIFITLGVRSKLLVLYILTFSFVIIYSIAYDNLIPDNLTFLSKQFWVRFGTIFGSFIGLSYLLFSEVFFDLSKNQFPKIYWAYAVFKSLLIISVVLFIFWYPVGNRMVYFLTPLAGIFLSFSSGYLFFYKKVTSLRFYFIGSSLFILVAILYASSNVGIINSFFLSQYGLKLGYLIQVGVFALAIGDKYILDQRGFQNILEQKVEERTSELESTLNQLRVRQHQLIHSEKMASVGSLTSGIAHELNNPLNFIAGGLTILQNAKEENADVIDMNEALDITLPMIQEGLDRSIKVVSSLSSFAYGGKPKFEKTDLTELIENTLLVLNSSLPTHINVARNLTFEQQVNVKREGLHQLIFSIVENAIWVIKKENNANGEIRISLVQNDQNPDFYDLSIFNTGAALKTSIMNQMFDPFFSTKEKGTGLGLSIASNIAKDHKGSLTAHNIQHGVQFTLTAPINPQTIL